MLRQFFTDERGAELAEYAIGVAILVAVAVVVLDILGQAVNDRMNQVVNEIEPAPVP